MMPTPSPRLAELTPVILAFDSTSLRRITPSSHSAFTAAALCGQLPMFACPRSLVLVWTIIVAKSLPSQAERSGSVALHLSADPAFTASAGCRRETLGETRTQAVCLGLGNERPDCHLRSLHAGGGLHRPRLLRGANRHARRHGPAGRHQEPMPDARPARRCLRGGGKNSRRRSEERRVGKECSGGWSPVR